MADIDLQERKAEDIPAPTEDKNAEHKASTSKKEVDAQLQQRAGMVQLVPTQHGNEMQVLLQLMASINKNLAFLAVTIHKHLNPDGK